MENLQPKLRFPEFRDVLKVDVIENICKVDTGNKDTQNKVENGEYPFFVRSNNVEKINSFSYDGEAVLTSGDGVGVGKNYHYINGKFDYHQRVYCMKDFENVNARYFYYQFSNKFYNRVMRMTAKNSVDSVRRDMITKMEFFIPSIQEQTKIADFLGAVDKQLDILNQKKEKLNTYKKGVMQQLFAQQLRFKDDNGNNYPDWQEKTLGEIGFFQTSSVDKLSRENEREIYLVNYMNVYRHEIIDNTTIKSFQVVTAKDNQIISCNLLKGDILFTPSSETPSDIGHSVVIFEDVNNAVFSYHLMRFRPKIELNLMYSHYFCNIPKVLNQLTKYATGSTRFTISVKSFSKVLVDIPSIVEQTKIANFLSAIDNQIEAVENQITKTETYKKGLLQQMFV